MDSFFDSQIFAYAVLPFLIFLARIADVSMQTLRIIFISKNFKLLAAVIGFFEVLIWLTAITQIMKNLNNPFCYVAYGMGFATGTYLGIKIENRLSLGRIIVRVFVGRECGRLTASMRERGYGLTIVDARGTKDKVILLFSIMERQKLPEFEEILAKLSPGAFYTVEDIRHSQGGYFQGFGKPRKSLRYLLFQNK